MFGVSPAWFVSKFGTNFTVYEMIESFSIIKETGFEHVQLEMYHSGKIGEWNTQNINFAISALKANQLVSTQFVAHFMAGCFHSIETLKDTEVPEIFKKLVINLQNFENLSFICIPLPAINIKESNDISLNEEIQKRSEDRLLECYHTVKRYNFKLCVEIIPFSFIGGLKGFSDFKKKFGLYDLGLCFDTKHAFFAKEDLARMIRFLGESIVSTHLCDNYGVENISNRPGNGLINWDDTFKAFLAAGYKGSYDLEIGTNSDNVLYEYRTGLETIKNYLKK